MTRRQSLVMLLRYRCDLNFFSWDLKKIIFLVVILALPLLSINMEQKPNQDGWLAKPFQLVAGYFQQVFFTFSDSVRSPTAQYLNLVDIKKQSENLKSRNHELEARLQVMGELERENERLKKVLEFKETYNMHLLAAQVIGKDLIPDHNSITINKGTDNGLKTGQAVITLGGVLGYVFRPEKTTAHIMLITDRYAVVDGIVQRSRAHGIVEGKNEGLTLKYVERTEDVKVGDLVVTGGLDNLLPKGFPVAVVENVERKTFSVSLKVDLKPVVDSTKVEEVLVVVDAKNVDLEPNVVDEPTGEIEAKTQ